jgi:hypothetical protein
MYSHITNDVNRRLNPSYYLLPTEQTKCLKLWKLKTYLRSFLQILNSSFQVLGLTRQTQKRVRESLLPWKSNRYYLLACVCIYALVCMRACGYPGAWTCACAYVHVTLLNQHANRMRHIVTSFVVPRLPSNFSTLSLKRCDFRKKVIKHNMCVSIFSTTFV